MKKTLGKEVGFGLTIYDYGPYTSKGGYVTISNSHTSINIWNDDLDALLDALEVIQIKWSKISTETRRRK